MALDASEVLGAPQLAGVRVNPRGFSLRQSSLQVGTVPTTIVLGRRSDPDSGATPRFGRLAFLAVTNQELALVRLRTRNGVTLKVSEVIARVPRGEVKTAELLDGYVQPLTVVFGNGDTWRLEVPPFNSKSAQRVVDALRS